MNKHLYRIIFNEHRGQCMAVAEVANAHAGGSTGETMAQDMPSSRKLIAAMGGVSLACLIALGGVLWLMPSPSHAQVVAYRTAPSSQQPTVLQTSNGVPQVNIQTPSAAGVSRNLYSQFDVQSNGVILNNSRTNVQTQLGGWIQGNPWLATGSAKVILNEVSSSNPSYLNGYVEVAGQRADVVIANPAGISVSGGGFINASKATLTTGSPVLNNGNLEGYRVQTGSVVVNGNGLDLSTTDYAAILARSVQINAGVWANELKVVTGPNQIDASTLTANTTPVTTAIAGTGAAPSYALDVAQLGGMYAGKITLIGTENGLGVRNAGQIQATAGGLTLSQDGWLQNSGVMQSSADMSLHTTASLSSSGTLYATGSMQIDSGGDQTHSGTVASQAAVSISAAGQINANTSSLIVAGVQGNGQLVDGQSLNIQATGTAQLAGQTIATQDLYVQGASVDISQGQLSAQQASLKATNADLIAKSSQITVAQNLTLDAPKALNTEQAKIQAGQLQLNVTSWNNTRGVLEQTGTTDLSIDLHGGALTNTSGTIIANATNLNLSAGAVNNTTGVIGHAGTGQLSVNASSVDNTQGQIIGNGSAVLKSTGKLSNADGLISSNADLSVSSADLDNTVTGSVKSATGIQSQSGNVTLSAQALTNSGSIYAAKNLSSQLTSLNNSGSLYAVGQQNLNVTHGVVNSATVAAGKDLSLQAASVSASGGNVLAAGMAADGKLSGTGALSVHSSGVLQTSGQALATGNVNLSGSSLDLSSATVGSTGSAAAGAGAGAGDVSLVANSGNVLTKAAQVSSPGQLSISANSAASQTLDNTAGQLSGKQLKIEVGQLDNTRGVLEQTGTTDLSIDLHGGALTNTSGTIIANATNLSLSAGAVNNTAGVIGHAGTGQLSVNASSVDNTQGQIIGNGSAVLKSTGKLSNADGLISSNADLSVSSADLDNTVTGSVKSATGIQSQSGNVTLSAQALTNSGSIYAAKNLSSQLTSLNNSGSLYAVGQQNLNVTHGVVNSATVAAGKDLSLQAASVSASGGNVLAAGMAADGKLSGTGALSVHSSGVLQTSGQALATGNVNLSGSSLDLSSATVGSTGSAGAGDVSLVANSGNVLTKAAQVSSPGQLSISANSAASQTLDNTAGQLSGKQLKIEVGQLDNTRGVLEQTGTTDLSIDLHGGALTNTSGTIIANATNLNLSAGAVNNTTGVIGHAGTGQLSVNASSVDNTQGQIIGNGSAVLKSTGKLSNADGLISSNADLSVSSADLDNTVTGSVKSATGIQSQSGNVTLSAQALTNSGSIYAAKNLSSQLTSLNNSGSLYAVGQQNLNVTHGVVNSATVAAGKDLSLQAASVSASGGNVLAAGMAADGKLSGTGALSVHSSGVLQTSGQALATGNVNLSGSSLDLSSATVGSTGSAGAGDVSLVANSGNVLTKAAQVSSPGQLSISANSAASQTLDNTAGQLSGKQLKIEVGQLDNTRGVLEQTGTTDLSIDLHGGALTNTSGTIIANATNLNLSAGAVNNTTGVIGHAGTGQLSVNASSVDNTQGQIIGNGSAVLKSTGKLSNADGLISSNADLSVSSADLDNTVTGSVKSATGIQSQSGNVTLSAQALTNSGSIYAAKNLSSQLTSLNNSGSLYAVGQQNLNVTHGVVNSATVAAGKDLSLQAASVSASGGNVLAAGMAADGKLSGTGALSVHSSGVLQTSGQALATGNVNLSGSSLDLSSATVGSTGSAGAGDVSLVANSGNVLTKAAQVSSPGQLSISANSAASQTLDNTAGQLSGKQLKIEVGQLDNTRGVLEQTGTTDLSIDLHGGALTNTSGTIIANATNLNLSAGAVNNTAGVIGHAGTGQLSVNASSVDNTQGQIIGNGSAVLKSTGKLSNADGLISSNADLSVSSADLDNTVTGSVKSATGIQSQSGNVTLSAQALTNSGSIYAAKNLSSQLTSLNNSGSLYAVGQQNLNVTHGVVNSATVAAGKDLSLQAASVSASGGNVLAAGMAADGKLSGTGALSVHSSGVLQTSGQALATGNVNLSGSSLDLSSATVGSTGSAGAGDVSLVANSGNVLTKAAQVSSPGQLSISANSAASQTLDNTAGQLSGKQLKIEVGQLDNTRGVIEQTGTGDQVANVSSTGSLTNTSGTIIANATNLNLSAGAVNNTAGVIGHAGTGQLSVNASSVDNTQGQIIGNGSAVLKSTGKLSNADGLISSNADLSVSSADLDNTVTGSVKSATGIQSQSGNVTLSAQALTNSGSIYAAKNLSSQLTSLNNSGSLYAVGQQNLNVTHGVVNSATVAAGKDLSLQAASVSASGGNVLAAGMAADGKLSGTGALSVHSSGVLQTSGQALATGNVNLSGSSLDLSSATVGSTGSAGAGDVSLVANSGNVLTKAAQVSSPGQLSISANSAASQTLDNTAGQLSGKQLKIEVGQLDNTRGVIEQTGTGDQVANVSSTGSLTNTSGTIIANATNLNLSAGAVNNTAGVIGHAGTGQLSVNASSVDNTQGQIIGNGSAVLKSTGKLSNADGLISSNADLSVSSADLDNTVTGSVKSATGIQSQSGNVTLSAQALTNSGSIYAAKNLSSQLTSLNNSGSLYAVGQQNLNVTHGVVNSATVAAGKDLSLQAASVSASGGNVLAAGMAADGKLSGTGALSVHSSGVLQTSGQALATGNVNLSGSSLDLSSATVGSTGSAGAGDVSLVANSGNVLTKAAQVSSPGQLSISANSAASQTLDNTAGQLSGKQLKIEVGQLDNTRGVLEQTGTGDQVANVSSTGSLTNTSGTIIANATNLSLSAGAVNNTAGVIGHAGTGQLSVNASSVDNTQGQIIGNGSAVLKSTGKLSNADGLISSNADLSVSSADLDNTVTGSVKSATGIQSQSGNVTLSAQALTNSGSIYAAKNLSSQLTSLNNSGSLYAVGQQNLNVTHGVVNSATVAAGKDLSLQAASVSASGGNVLAAGMAADGKLSGTGALSVHSSGVLQTSGQALATGNVNLSGSSLDLSSATVGSTGSAAAGAGAGAGDVSLVANSGNVLTKAAQVSSPGQLSISANSAASQTLDNTAGQLSGKQLKIEVGQLDNTRGVLEQTGTGDQVANVSSTGSLTNTSGTIIANATNLSLSAGAVNNTTGVIGHAGTGQLSVNASSVDNTQGQIIGNGSLTLNSSQAVMNSTGLISAQQNLSVQASRLDNRQGKLVSVVGDLSLRTTSQASATNGVDNTLGLIQAGQDLNLNLQGANNGLQNNQGKIIAVRDASLTTGALSNETALIAAGRDLHIDTQNQTLSNLGSRSSNATAPLGLVAGGQLSISSGQLDNRAGLLSAQTLLNIVSTGTIDNTNTGDNQQGGLIYSAGDVSLQAGQINNTGGQILAVQNTSIDTGSGALNNSQGLVRTGQTLTVKAARVDNSGTLATNADGSPKAMGLEGTTVDITTGELNNAQGAVRAAQNLTVRSDNQINNDKGELSAGGILQITTAQSSTPSLRLSNAQGLMVADQAVGVTAASLSGAGTIVSKGDVSLSLQGDHTLAGTLLAGGNMNLQTTGTLTNPLSVQAGKNLSVSAQNLDNQATGELLSGQTTQLNAADTLTNRGLVDGADTRIVAGVVNNLGTGRIYGNRVAIGATTLNNQEETANGQTLAATIAGRGRVDIGVQNLTNKENALIYSAGNMAVGGMLDANWQATGRAQMLVNASATIEAAANMALAGVQMNNLNLHFASEIQQQPDQVGIVEYEGQGASTRYKLGTPGVFEYSDESLHLQTPDDRYETWYKYDYTRQTQQSVITQSAPAKIYAGAGLTLSSDAITNDKSDIVAGGALSINANSLNNIAGEGVKLINDVGTKTTYWRNHRRGTDNTGSSQQVYQPATVSETINLGGVRYEEYANDTTGNSSPTAKGVIAVEVSANSIGAVSNGKNTVQLEEVNGTSASNATGAVTSKQTSAAASTGQNAQANAAQDSATTAQTRAEVGLNATSALSKAEGRDTTKQASAAASTGQNAQANAAQDSVTTAQTRAEVGLNETSALSKAEGRDTTKQASAAASTGQSAQANAAQGSATTAQTRAEVGLSEASALSKAEGRDTTKQTSAAASTGQSAQANAAQDSDTTKQASAVASTAQSAQTTQVRKQTLPGSVPNSSLYRQHPESTAKYLVETDPQFASYRKWLSSDYILSALQVSPTTAQKRLGDGYYEQKLIREQVANLTGKRFLGDYTSDEQEYQALMDNGVTYAKQNNLRPGIALTDAQMAALTSDMVWLVNQEVTLADGSKQNVLVPQVYVHVQPGDLDGSGALLSGADVNLKLAGDLTNNGSVAGRNVVNISADNIRNMGGEIQGDILSLASVQDLDNTGGQIAAGQAALLSAGRDLNLTTTTQSSANQYDKNSFSQTGIDRVASLYVSGVNGILVASAGRDMNLTAAQVNSQGAVLLSAQGDLNLKTVNTGKTENLIEDANNYHKVSSSQDVGTQISAANQLSLSAGKDLNAKAASVSAGQTLDVVAGGNVNLMAGQSSMSLDDASKVSGHSGGLAKTTTTTRISNASTVALGTSFEGANVSIQAGKDLSVKGSNVLADQNVALNAAGNVNIEAAQNTNTSTSFTQTTKSGLMSGGSLLSVSVGTRQQSLDSQGTGTSAAASTVGAINGDVSITAGQQYKQVGSDISTPNGSIDIHAKTVAISEARETGSQSSEQKFKQSGLTLAITSPVLNGLQSINSQIKAAGNTSSNRMQALAAANVAMNARNASNAVTAGQGDENGMVKDANGNLVQGNAADKAGGVSISLSYGQSSSQSKQQSSAESARGSTLEAGGNIRIQAVGDGANSNLTVQGSDIKTATGLVSLKADNAIEVLAAQNSTRESSNQSSQSSSIGIGINLGNAGGGGASGGVILSASVGKGQGAGNSTTYTNSHITGAQVQMDSGGDTTIKGGVVTGQQVTANVGGNLNIESLQDSNQYKEKSQQIGGSVTIGPAPAASLSLAATKINSNYLSVTEQSGIKTGDGGFTVNVGGNTALVGGAITSTQAAIDNNKNSFQTGGKLTTSDIQNTASYDAKSISVTVSASAGGAGLSAAGFGGDSGSAASTTTAGISGIAGDKAKRTGDKEQGIAQIFNKDKVKADVTAQVAITQEFGKQASKFGGTEADKQRDALKAQARQAIENGNPEQAQALLEESAKWDEGGTYRVAMHTAIGGLTGGTAGAVGAGSASAAAPAIEELQTKLQNQLVAAGVNPGVAQGIASLTSGATAAAIGSVASGGTVAGGATAFNADMNNRQLHPDQIKGIQKLSSDPKKQSQLTAVLCVMQNCDINGLSGYDANGQSIYETGKQLQSTNPELFKQLASEINSAGLLSGQFAYQFGDFVKDAFGKKIGDTGVAVKNAYDLATRKPEDLGSVVTGAVKGLANNVKDAPQYPLDGADEKQGAILANTALVVGPTAAGAAAGTLNAMGRAWEAGKVLNAGEIAMSNGGNISAQQITRVATPAGLTTTEMNTLSNLDSLSSNAAGAVRETVSNSYFERNGFKAMDGKCGSNCFDGVYIKGDQVIVNEVKPLNADGSIKLSGGNEGTGLKTQMSDEWIVSRAEALRATNDPAKVQVGNQILAARNSGNLTTVVSGVNSNGMVIVKVKP